MKKQKIIIILVLAIVFTASAFLAFSGILSDFEAKVNLSINPNKEISGLMKFFTDIGEAKGVILITAFFMLLPVTRRRVGAPLSVTVISSWLLCTAIKYSVRRERPALRLLKIGGFSFPSGHAMNNAALYIGIMILILRLCRNRMQRIIVSVLCIFFPLTIGISRMYFNVHYFTDVVCGWCLGSIVAILFTQSYFNLEEKHKIRNGRDE